MSLALKEDFEFSTEISFSKKLLRLLIVRKNFVFKLEFINYMLLVFFSLAFWMNFLYKLFFLELSQDLLFTISALLILLLTAVYPTVRSLMKENALLLIDRLNFRWNFFFIKASLLSNYCLIESLNPVIIWLILLFFIEKAYGFYFYKSHLDGFVIDFKESNYYFFWKVRTN